VRVPRPQARRAQVELPQVRGGQGRAGQGRLRQRRGARERRAEEGPRRSPGRVMRTHLKRAGEAWQRARQRWWVRWGVDVAVAALLFMAVMAWQTRHLPGAGTPAPDFQLRTLSGEQVRLSELRGKPVVLAFWAPWCGVCKAESSTLSALRRTVG